MDEEKFSKSVQSTQQMSGADKSDLRNSSDACEIAKQSTNDEKPGESKMSDMENRQKDEENCVSPKNPTDGKRCEENQQSALTPDDKRHLFDKGESAKHSSKDEQPRESGRSVPNPDVDNNQSDGNQETSACETQESSEIKMREVSEKNHPGEGHTDRMEQEGSEMRDVDSDHQPGQTSKKTPETEHSTEGEMADTCHGCEALQIGVINDGTNHTADDEQLEEAGLSVPTNDDDDMTDGHKETGEVQTPETDEKNGEPACRIEKSKEFRPSEVGPDQEDGLTNRKNYEAPELSSDDKRFDETSPSALKPEEEKNATTEGELTSASNQDETAQTEDKNVMSDLPTSDKQLEQSKIPDRQTDNGRNPAHDYSADDGHHDGIGPSESKPDEETNTVHGGNKIPTCDKCPTDEHQTKRTDDTPEQGNHRQAESVRAEVESENDTETINSEERTSICDDQDKTETEQSSDVKNESSADRFGEKVIDESNPQSANDETLLDGARERPASNHSETIHKYEPNDTPRHPADDESQMSVVEKKEKDDGNGVTGENSTDGKQCQENEESVLELYDKRDTADNGRNETSDKTDDTVRNDYMPGHSDDRRAEGGETSAAYPKRETRSLDDGVVNVTGSSTEMLVDDGIEASSGNEAETGEIVQMGGKDEVKYSADGNQHEEMMTSDTGNFLDKRDPDGEKNATSECSTEYEQRGNREKPVSGSDDAKTVGGKEISDHAKEKNRTVDQVEHTASNNGHHKESETAAGGPEQENSSVTDYSTAGDENVIGEGNVQSGHCISDKQHRESEPTAPDASQTGSEDQSAESSAVDKRDSGNIKDDLVSEHSSDLMKKREPTEVYDKDETEIRVGEGNTENCGEPVSQQAEAATQQNRDDMEIQKDNKIRQDNYASKLIRKEDSEDSKLSDRYGGCGTKKDKKKRKKCKLEKGEPYKQAVKQLKNAKRDLQNDSNIQRPSSRGLNIPANNHQNPAQAEYVDHSPSNKGHPSEPKKMPTGQDGAKGSYEPPTNQVNQTQPIAQNATQMKLSEGHEQGYRKISPPGNVINTKQTMVNQSSRELKQQNVNTWQNRQRQMTNQAGQTAQTEMPKQLAHSTGKRQVGDADIINNEMLPSASGTTSPSSVSRQDSTTGSQTSSQVSSTPDRRHQVRDANPGDDSKRSEINKRQKPREPTYDDDDRPRSKKSKIPSDVGRNPNLQGNFRGFAGKDDVLSNFYYCDLYVYNMYFWSTEQAYQWRKAKFMGNEEAANEIYDAEYASQAKRIANQYFRGTDMSKWIPHRVPVMKQLIRAKARSCKRFSDELRNLGDRYIAEVVPGDQYWAIGDGTGQNVMGNLLMDLRDHLDEALSADREEDGKMFELDDKSTSAPLNPDNLHTKSVLLISNDQLGDINCDDFVKDVVVTHLIKTSIDETQRYIEDNSIFDYSAVVLHLLSYNNVIEGDPDQLVKQFESLLYEITKKMNRPKVIISLAMFPYLSNGDYYNRADCIKTKLCMLRSKIVTCRKNGLRMKLNECFNEDGTLTQIAQQQLKKNLADTIQHHLQMKRFDKKTTFSTR